MPGKAYMVENGVEIISLSDAEREAFRAKAQAITDKQIAATEAEGLPARAFYDRMRDLAAAYGR